MRIEDNYKDVIIYNVTFKTEDNREISRVLILNARENEIANSTIEDIVLSTFNNVFSIIRIVEIMDALLLRETSKYYLTGY